MPELQASNTFGKNSLCVMRDAQNSLFLARALCDTEQRFCAMLLQNLLPLSLLKVFHW